MSGYERWFLFEKTDCLSPLNSESTGAFDQRSFQMRLTSWLANSLQKLSHPPVSTELRRSRRPSKGVASIIDRLEPRQLLTTGVAAIGLESRVNTYVSNDQQAAALAIDSAGDFVIAWQSNGQDGSAFGIYAQRYTVAGTSVGNEFLVNTYTTMNQSAPTVAMDAAGDFVIAWQSELQDGGGYGIYAQRYNAAGVAVGTEFLVNTYTTGSQTQPAIAMDTAGDFVVTWESYGQDGSGYGVYARRFNAAGTAQGLASRVNTYTTSAQSLPSVAMDATGDFVIAWQSYTQDGSGYGIYAQRYNSAGVAQGAEFQVNTSTANYQMAPSVAMDTAGDFVIAWESALQDGSGYGIYAHRYNSTGVGQGSVFQVNTYTTGAQLTPKVAMDAAGDFVVTWSSSGQDGNLYGIQAQRYNAAGNAQASEFRVNTYTTNQQSLPAVAMNAEGNFTIAWQSLGQDGSGNGVYAQQYVATVGPIVTAVLAGAGPFVLRTGVELASSPSRLSVNFSDPMNVVAGGTNSVTNPTNWRLTRYGIEVTNQISGISFGFNSITNRYVAVVTFISPLIEGGYQLIVRQTIQDANGRTLDGEADGIPGGDFRRNFSVAATSISGGEIRANSYTTGNQNQPSVAMDASGDYVMVWESKYQDGSAYGVFAQRFSAAGLALGGEFQVNTYTTSDQFLPAVAMDAAGDFVITWTTRGQDGDAYGVYAKRYNSVGIAQGGEFQVNTYTTGSQLRPAVAMDTVGDFVITWSSIGQNAVDYDIYAQRYNAAGVAQSSEFKVNTAVSSTQRDPSVAMDAVGDFVIAYQSIYQNPDVGDVFAHRYNAAGIAQGNEFKVNTADALLLRPFASVASDNAGDFVVSWFDANQDGGGFGIDARAFNANGDPQGAQFRVNTYTVGNQRNARVAMDAAGDCVIAWESALQDGSGYGVYAQRFSSLGAAYGNEFRVNTTTQSDQSLPAVAMDAAGDCVIAWQSNSQDGDKYGVYAQRYRQDVSPWMSQIEADPLNAAGSLSTPMTSSLLIFDSDNTTLTGATIQISINDHSDQDVLSFVNTATITGTWNAATGTLTLTGTDTVSNYRTALRKVTYHNTSASPNTSVTRTIDFQVTDGLLLSNIVSRDLTVVTTSTPAILSGVSGTGTYVESSSAITLGPNLVISDPGTTNLASATVSFTNWQAEDRVTFNNVFALQHSFTQNLTNHTASLVISGIDTVDHYQTLLRTVAYSDVSSNPVTSNRVASFTVSDGLSTSNLLTRQIAVVSVNNRPSISAIETAPLICQANNSASLIPISATLLVSDPDSTNLTKAVLTILNFQSGDKLSFTTLNGITGSFDAVHGILTLTGTSGVGNYRTALRSVIFSTTGIVGTRTLSITTTDDFSPSHATSTAITRPVTVTTANIPPALTGVTNAALGYVRGTASKVVAPGLVTLDSDGINLASATIQIISNYQNGQDVLGFAAGFGVTGSFNSSTGTLTLTGVSSLANYQTLLRSVTFKTNSAAANTSPRTISFTINDGLTISSAVTRNVVLT